MCGKETGRVPVPVPDTEDAHADWVNKVTANLAQNVNSNISIKQEKNKMLILSNINEDDLGKIQFVTNTDINNTHGRLVAIGVTIPGNGSNPLSITIPGLSQHISKIFDDSDAQAFLDGKKLHTPLVTPFIAPLKNTPMSVSLFVDFMTAMIPSMPKTANKQKTYSLTFNPKSR